MLIIPRQNSVSSNIYAFIMSCVHFKRDIFLLLLVSRILARAPHVLQALLVLEVKFTTKVIEESHCVAHGHRDGCQQSVTGQTMHNLDLS